MSTQLLLKISIHIYCLETKLHNCNSTLIRWYLVGLIWSVGYNTDKDRHAYAARDYSCSCVCVCVCVYTSGYLLCSSLPLGWSL